MHYPKTTWYVYACWLAVGTLAIKPHSVRAQRTPAPSGLEVTGTSASATVTWQPVRGAVSYSVKRWKQDDPKCCKNSVEGLTRPAWTDEGSDRKGFPQPGIYVFEVTAQLEGATAAAVVNWTLSDPARPNTNLTLVPVGPVSAVLAPVTPAAAPSQPAPIQAPLERPTASPRTPMTPPQPPTSISFTSTPTRAKVHWGSPTGDLSGLKSYSVERWKQDSPNCCRQAVDGLLGHEWQDGGLPQAGAYVYRVSAVYADGSRVSAEATFNNPMPKNPTSISYSRASPASLKLTWSAVPYAAYYKLWGASNPDTGRYVGPCNNQPSAALQSAAAKFGQVIPPTCDVMVPAVKDSGNWMVGAFYQPGDISSPSTEFTRLTLTPPAPTPAPPAGPKYRVSITGFKVNHETEDDPFSLDGRGDEIYLSAVVLEPTALKPNAAWTARSQLVESKVFGDRNQAPDRIKAGSRSGDGGLQTGDVVVLPDPLVVWDGPITTPFLVIPTIWEADGPAVLGIQSAWYDRMRPPSGSTLNQWGQFYNTPTGFEYPTIKARGLSELLTLYCNCYIGTADAKAYGAFQNPMMGYTRPIAVNTSGGFNPAAVSVSTANLAAFLGSNNSGTFPVNYKDGALGSGDYTLTLRFEKVP